MANVVKTITVSLRLFGNAPTEKFASANTRSDALVYGTDVWGASTIGVTEVIYKWIADEGFAVTSTVGFKTGKWLSESLLQTTTVGLIFSKWTAETLGTTSTIGNRVLKNIFETPTLSSTIGKNIQHLISEAPVLTTTIGRFFSKNIYNTLDITTQPEVYRYRSGWADALDGNSDLISWAKASSLTASAAVTTTWSEVAAVTTTWS